MLWPLPSVAKNASLPSADALLWDTGSFAQRRFPPDSLYTIAGGSAEPEVWADASSDYCSVSSPHLLSWRPFMNDWPAPAVPSTVGLP